MSRYEPKHQRPWIKGREAAAACVVSVVFVLLGATAQAQTGGRGGATQVAQAQAPAAPGGEEGFVSQDQSGNDPREFSSKFMPYYRYTELENDLEVQELYLFGFFAFTGRFGMTYEFPLAKHIDYSDVDDFEAATSGGCPPGAGAGSFPPIGPLPGGGGGGAVR